MQRELPLFPLNTVLFPGSTIPLFVFEERYKLMMSRCVEGDRSFGVTLIKSGVEVGGPAEPYMVGTLARIGDIYGLEDGRMFISVTGGQRFRIIELIALTPYLVGRVELLSEGEELGPGKELMDAVQASVDSYMRAAMGLQGGWMRHFSLLSDPRAISYYIADTLIGELRVKQRLLETSATEERLRLEVEALRSETERLQEELKERGMGRFSSN